MLDAAQADERNPPRLSDISGKWSFTSITLDRAGDAQPATGPIARFWQAGTLEITDRSMSSLRDHLTGTLVLDDGTQLSIQGRRKDSGYGEPARIEFKAAGTKPNEFGGPPTELEYEFEGRFSPIHRKDAHQLSIRGLVQAIRTDRLVPEFTVGAFILTPSEITDDVLTETEK